MNFRLAMANAHAAGMLLPRREQWARNSSKTFAAVTFACPGVQLTRLGHNLLCMNEEIAGR
jgi:hypothetical protein